MLVWQPQKDPSQKRFLLWYAEVLYVTQQRELLKAVTSSTISPTDFSHLCSAALSFPRVGATETSGYHFECNLHLIIILAYRKIVKVSVHRSRLAIFETAHSTLSFSFVEEAFVGLLNDTQPKIFNFYHVMKQLHDLLEDLSQFQMCLTWSIVPQQGLSTVKPKLVVSLVYQSSMQVTMGSPRRSLSPCPKHREPG